MTADRTERPTYRIDVRFQADRVFVTMLGSGGPDAERHLREVRAAAAKCDLDVVVRRPPR